MPTNNPTAAGVPTEALLIPAARTVFGADFVRITYSQYGYHLQLRRHYVEADSLGRLEELTGYDVNSIRSERGGCLTVELTMPVRRP